LADPLRAVSRLRSLRRPSPPTLAALALFAVALAVRLVWVSFVDSPYDNVFSDMGGYVDRALDAAHVKPDAFPIFATLYPPGTHLVYAAEMKLVGWTHHGPMLLLNCMWGAVVAPCTMLLAMRIVPRLAVAVPAGLAMALWYPLLAFSGFFSSEQPYAGALALSAWLLVRQVESGKSTVGLGVTSSIAYLVRPQVILTLFALTLAGLYVLWRRTPRLRVGRLVLAGAILTGTVAFGAVRYHALSGRWGLVSDNAAMTRLWADTDYGRVRATWHSPDGRNLVFFFGSPPKNEIGETRELTFDGYVGDPEKLDLARRLEVMHMTPGARALRWVKNVRLLFAYNSLWPDSLHQGKGWRWIWSEASRRVLLVFICPLALLGIAACLRRPTTVLVVCTAHIATALVVAAFFFAEARYRVPYDMFLVLLALEGACTLWFARDSSRGQGQPDVQVK